MLLFNGSNRCEVAKLAFCSEDVKTAALPPCEIAPDGGGCVKITDCSKKPVFSNLKIPRFSRKGVPPSRKASEDKGGIGGRQYTEADVSAFFT